MLHTFSRQTLVHIEGTRRVKIGSREYCTGILRKDILGTSTLPSNHEGGRTAAEVITLLKLSVFPKETP